MNSLENKLRDLARGKTARSETAKLRDVIDSVEEAIRAGVSRSAVLETLNAEGFRMSLKAFENALYRIRKRRAAGRSPASPGAKQAQETQVNNSPEPRRKVTNPAELRQIRKREINLEDYQNSDED